MAKCSEIICEAYKLKEGQTVATLEAGTFSQPESLDFYGKGYEVWMMEPIAGSFNILAMKTRLLPDIHKQRLLNAAISYKTGKSIIQHCPKLPGHSSLSHGEEHKEELASMGVGQNQVEIQCYTYKHLTENIIGKKVNILILDIEGHEIPVLESIKKEVNQEYFPDIICIECGYDWEDRLKILESMGYEADFFEYNNCYLSLKNSNLLASKNEDFINQTNQDNPHFVWNDKYIYKNHLIK